jgi:ParB family chromosome partitioning protein
MNRRITMSTKNTEPKAAEAASTVPEVSTVQLISIPVDQFVDFKHHIFKPYTEQRMGVLVASVQENGIIHPVVVRHAKDKGNQGKFETVSGHSRIRAAKLAGLKEVPAVVMELSDEQAIFLANEANIQSRNLSTWLPSERIQSINQYHTAVKSQGKAKDPNQLLGVTAKSQKTAMPVRGRRMSTFRSRPQGYTTP